MIKLMADVAVAVWTMRVKKAKVAKLMAKVSKEKAKIDKKMLKGKKDKEKQSNLAITMEVIGKKQPKKEQLFAAYAILKQAGYDKLAEEARELALEVGKK